MLLPHYFFMIGAEPGIGRFSEEALAGFVAESLSSFTMRPSGP
jgi:hypothetical protein